MLGLKLNHVDKTPGDKQLPEPMLSQLTDV